MYQSVYILIPYFHKHGINQNIARAVLNCQRDYTTKYDDKKTRLKISPISIYVDITEDVHLFLFLSFYFVSYNLVVFLMLIKCKTMPNW